jgi:hypothetical protein
LRRLVEPGQYTSLAFGRRLRESGIAASMGSIGDIEVFYNRIRRHSSLRNLSPERFEGALSFISGHRGRMRHHRPRNRGNRPGLGMRIWIPKRR